MVDFGVVLRTLRQQSGMTQKELGEKIGVTKSVISYYELQERSPSPEILIKVAQVFHVSTDYLLGLEQTRIDSIDVSGLTAEDIALLQHMIRVLRQKNEQCGVS